MAVSKPKWRVGAGIAAILLLIAVLAVLVASSSATIERWPVLGQALFYLVMGMIGSAHEAIIDGWRPDGSEFVRHFIEYACYMATSPYLMTTMNAFDPPNLWRRFARIAGMAGLGLIGVAAVVGTAGSLAKPDEAPSVVAPPPLAMEYRPVAPVDAVKINSSIPIAGPGGAARPFLFAGASSAAQARALECLASAI